MTDTPLTVERVRRLHRWAKEGIASPEVPETGFKDYLAEVMAMCVTIADMEADYEWDHETGDQWHSLYTELTKEE